MYIFIHIYIRTYTYVCLMICDHMSSQGERPRQLRCLQVKAVNAASVKAKVGEDESLLPGNIPTAQMDDDDDDGSDSGDSIDDGEPGVKAPPAVDPTADPYLEVDGPIEDLVVCRIYSVHFSLVGHGL